MYVSLKTHHYSFLIDIKILCDAKRSHSTQVASARGPSRTVLSPLLYLLYVNDLPSWVRLLKVKLYADDVLLYKVYMLQIVNCKSYTLGSLTSEMWFSFSRIATLSFSNHSRILAYISDKSVTQNISNS